MPITEEQLQAVRDAERNQIKSGESYDHFHHCREFYSWFIYDKRFTSREEAKEADRYNGHCVVLGCNVDGCDIGI